MKNIALAAMVTAALTSATIAFADTAGAAPSGWSDAEHAVKTLQSSGYRVTVNRNGTAPMSECTVTSVRRGSSPVSAGSHVQDSDRRKLAAATVVVEANC